MESTQNNALGEPLGQPLDQAPAQRSSILVVTSDSKTLFDFEKMTLDEKKPKFKTRQRQLSEFWEEFHAKAPGKVTMVFPRSLYKSLARSHHGSASPKAEFGINAAASYEEAAAACRAKVARIVRHCEMTNEKFEDPEFDLRVDANNCLHDLMSGYPCDDEQGGDGFPIAFGGFADAPGGDEKGAQPQEQPQGPLRRGKRAGGRYNPGSVHRVDWIFPKPQFTVDGYSASDIRQGALGDCWFLAGVAALAHRQDLMDKVMVARDEACGVYGFVFYRDGQWVHTVIDDNLCLSEEDFHEWGDTYDPTGKLVREHRATKQTGSKALMFAKCEHESETWLPLLEKAYAKIHNDFSAIDGGEPGEAVEDLCGGVNSTVIPSKVLKKDKFWQELVNDEGEFVFSLGLISGTWGSSKGGMATDHAYSLLKAVEAEGPNGEKVRLVKIRNPWGARANEAMGEWNGPWSDGSKEWTPYWMSKLDHKFGDDGTFWMTFEDMMDFYGEINRTRLFDREWTVAQCWTSMNVSWIAGYTSKRFVFDVMTPGLCVIVLGQLDGRYWQGLEGKYEFKLQFLLRKKEEKKTDADEQNGNYIATARFSDWESRSVNVEVELEAGSYEVIPKVIASDRRGARNIVDVVKKMAAANAPKLRQVGANYDAAHSRVGLRDEDEAYEKLKVVQALKEERKKKQEKEKAAATKKKQSAQKQKRHGQWTKDQAREERHVKKRNEIRALRREIRIKRMEMYRKASEKRREDRAKRREKLAKKKEEREVKRAAKEAEKKKEEEKKNESKDKGENKDDEAHAMKETSPDTSEKSAVVVDKEEVEMAEKTTKSDEKLTTVGDDADDESNEDEEDDGSDSEDESEKKEKEEKQGDKEEAAPSAAAAESSESSSEDSSEEEVSDDSVDDLPEQEVSTDEEFIPNSELESESFTESETENESDGDLMEDDEEHQGGGAKWNPVAILGLRVYAKGRGENDVKVTVCEAPATGIAM